MKSPISWLWIYFNWAPLFCTYCLYTEIEITHEGWFQVPSTINYLQQVYLNMWVVTLIEGIVHIWEPYSPVPTKDQEFFYAYSWQLSWEVFFHISLQLSLSWHYCIKVQVLFECCNGLEQFDWVVWQSHSKFWPSCRKLGTQ